ncbi:MAG: GNAT family N-acetyltransferase [Chloroflexota bacterium]
MSQPVREFAVAVFVVHGRSTLLLLHRKMNMWLPPGGHVEAGELPTEAAVREVREETGLAVELIGPQTPSFTGVRGLTAPMGCQLEDIIPGGHQHIDNVYLSRVVPGTEVTPRINSESRRLGWFAPGDLAGLGVNDEVRNWISHAFRLLGQDASPHALFDQSFQLVGRRVRLRPFRPADVPGLVRLWTDGRVMANVGFPNGLAFDLAKAERLFEDRYVGVDFVHKGLHLAVTDQSGAFLGEAFVGRANGLNAPDRAAGAAGALPPLSEPDVKLLPEFWGRGFGREIWQLLLDYTFANVPVDVVQVTPRVDNERATRLYASLGFVAAGPVRDSEHASGQRPAPAQHQTMWLRRRDWFGRRGASSSHSA